MTQTEIEKKLEDLQLKITQLSIRMQQVEGQIARMRPEKCINGKTHDYTVKADGMMKCKICSWEE